jgi:hypothetical protein
MTIEQWTLLDVLEGLQFMGISQSAVPNIGVIRAKVCLMSSRCGNVSSVDSLDFQSLIMIGEF